MKPNLVPADPLTQVVFVHEYLQLVFQDTGFSLYNPVELRLNGHVIRQNESGFADGLVGLIGQSVLSAATVETSGLALSFTSGTIVSVDSDGPGPEAWQFNSLGCAPVIAQNS